MANVHPCFLTDGGQSAAKVASALTAFCADARRALHVAIYNVMLDEDVARDLVRVLVRKARAGVEVRIAYDDTSATEGAGVDAKIPATKEWLRRHFSGSRVVLRAIRGSSLMHDKYVVRDAEAVWTGSANFTTDAWSRQENNVLVIEEPAIAALYEKDFAELWRHRVLARTGADADGVVTMRSGARIEVAFSPGDGAQIERRIAALVASARRRVLVASMVVSSPLVLRALCGALRRCRHGVSVHGVVDGAQMHAVAACWRRVGAKSPLAAWRALQASGAFVEKPSTPFDERRPGATHDFMHDKIVVVDDTVLTGSFNFSHHATSNAENVVVLTDRALSGRYATYIRGVIRRYEQR